MSTETTEAAPLAHRNLPLLLLQARERVIAQFRPILKAHGLTEQQWRVLRALVDAGHSVLVVEAIDGYEAIMLSC